MMQRDLHELNICDSLTTDLLNKQFTFFPPSLCWKTAVWIKFILYPFRVFILVLTGYCSYKEWKRRCSTLSGLFQRYNRHKSEDCCRRQKGRFVWIAKTLIRTNIYMFLRIAPAWAFCIVYTFQYRDLLDFQRRN